MAGSTRTVGHRAHPMTTEKQNGGWILTPRASFSFAALDSDPLSLRERVGHGASVELHTRDAVVVLAAIRVLDEWAAQVSLRSGDSHARVLGGVAIGSEACSPSHFLVSSHTDGFKSTTRATRWILHTSGTSGTPKAITHTMSSLNLSSRRETPRSPLKWGLLYDPTRMAGVQVLLHSMRTKASVVVPDLDAPLAEQVTFLREHGTDALSATPTLWRRILQVPAAVGWGLAQVTLGGEIADQTTLDALRRAFQTARITHVFAATESGTAFSVSDGRAGFPTSLLETNRTGTRIEVRDSLLYVFNPGSSAAGEDGFVCTGDVVELRAGRVFFLGRNTGVVNVGGHNVWPEQVEEVLRKHPEVRDVRVTAQPSSLAGNLLVADVVTGDAVTAGQLRAWVRARAPLSHVPARIRFAEQLATSTTGKALR